MDTLDDNKKKGQRVWDFTRRFILNKYVVVLLGFAFFMTFVSNRSLVNRFRRSEEIDSLTALKDSIRTQIDNTEQRIQSITSSKDSLERFAREKYFMHTKDEEVYIVNDQD